MSLGGWPDFSAVPPDVGLWRQPVLRVAAHTQPPAVRPPGPDIRWHISVSLIVAQCPTSSPRSSALLGDLCVPAFERCVAAYGRGVAPHSGQTAPSGSPARS